MNENRGLISSHRPLMIDFMSHLLESMLCKAISRSPGVSGDTVELPSPERRHNSENTSRVLNQNVCAGPLLSEANLFTSVQQLLLLFGSHFSSEFFMSVRWRQKWLLLCWVPRRRLNTSFTTIGLSLISLGRAWMTSFWKSTNQQHDK